MIIQTRPASETPLLPCVSDQTKCVPVDPTDCTEPLLFQLPKGSLPACEGSGATAVAYLVYRIYFTGLL